VRQEGGAIASSGHQKSVSTTRQNGASYRFISVTAGKPSEEAIVSQQPALETGAPGPAARAQNAEGA